MSIINLHHTTNIHTLFFHELHADPLIKAFLYYRELSFLLSVHYSFALISERTRTAIIYIYSMISNKNFNSIKTLISFMSSLSNLNSRNRRAILHGRTSIS